MTRSLLCLLTTVAIAFVSGCATVPDPCDGFKPIRPTFKDVDAISDQLTEQLLGHNQHGADVCGWKARQ